MEAIPHQTSENDKKSTKIAPEDDFSRNPYKSTRIWRLFERAILAFFISYIAFWFFSDDSVPPSKTNFEAYFNKMRGELSIQIDKKAIQASSLQEQIFPLFVSRRIMKGKPPSPAAVDLICMFDFSENSGYKYNENTHFVRRFFEQVFPLMRVQDRLSVMFLDGLREESPILEILPLTKMTRENQKKIISSLSENLLGNKIPMREIPLNNVLDQRSGMSLLTGIFLFSDENSEVFPEENIYKKRLGLQGVPTIVRSMMKRESDDQTESFRYGLKLLRHYVAETIFFVKPEQSQFLKGVKIIDTYLGASLEFEEGLPWRLNSDGALYLKSSWLDFGLDGRFFFDLKIPKIPQNLLPESPMEIKIASCRQVYILLDGTQVIKNAELTLKIYREGEEFVNEDDRGKDSMLLFYYSWENVISKRVKQGSPSGDSEKGLFERYKKSVEDSIVKDERGLQQSVEDFARNFNYSYSED